MRSLSCSGEPRSGGRMADEVRAEWRDVLDTFGRRVQEQPYPMLALGIMADFVTGLGVFAVGVLIGAGLGVMFAPKPGAEIRSRLTDTIKQRAGRGEEMPQASAMPGAPSVTNTRIS